MNNRILLNFTIKKFLTHFFNIFFFIFFIISCNSNVYYNYNYSFKNEAWYIDDIKTFNVTIDDTSSLYDVFLNIRNTGIYPYQNLFLFITINAPTNYYYIDTLEILIADEKGKWYGKGIGNNFYQKVLFKRNVKFPYRGIYRFDIQHGMREEKLEGISDIGLLIQKKQIPQKN